MEQATVEREEIVVGACYRDVRDSEIVRVLDVDDVFSPLCVIVRKSCNPELDDKVGDKKYRDWPRDCWVRVPDPTPAVIDDAEPPLAGELTARQIAAWAIAQDCDGCPRIGLTRIGGEWIVTMTHMRDPHGRIEQRQERGVDLQDAITRLMGASS